MFLLASLRSDRWSTCPELMVVFIGIRNMIQATLASVEISVADGGTVAGGVIANLVESVAESRLAALGDLAQAFGVAGFVSDQVEAGPGPDLTAFAEAVDGDDGRLRASG